MFSTRILFFFVFLTLTSTPFHNSNASSSLDEQWRAKLGERWLEVIKNPHLPEFLKAALDEEPLYAGAGLPAQESQALLKADEDRVMGQLSNEVPEDSPYFGLVHQMKRKYLLETLKSGQLMPRSGQFGNNSESQSQPGVYLELFTLNNHEHFSWGDIELVFIYQILNREDYLVNPGWMYGRFNMYSATPTVNPGRIKFFLESYLLKQAGNEFVFSQPISMEYLSQIVVPKGTKNSLVKELIEKRIPLPGFWKNWESNIKELDK